MGGRGLEGGGGAGLRVDGLAGGDAEVALRLGDPESEGVGRGALVFPGEGCCTDPLLGRRSLRLGSEEGRGESGIGLLSTEGGGGERPILGRHPRARTCDSSGGGIGTRGLQQLRSGPQGGRIGTRGLQQLRSGPQGGRIGTRGLQQLRSGPQGGRIDGGVRLGSRSPGACASSSCGRGGVGQQGAQGGRSPQQRERGAHGGPRGGGRRLLEQRSHGARGGSRSSARGRPSTRSPLEDQPGGGKTGRRRPRRPQRRECFPSRIAAVGGVQEEDAMVSGGRQDGGNAAHLNRRSATGLHVLPIIVIVSRCGAIASVGSGAVVDWLLDSSCGAGLGCHGARVSGD
ncbi:uncharacterized protein LOC112898131 [Panicum hallii]|uniref:uncharacterized protein LOC112898131 n=1 Tax=Panicum hallii TaxID=206008 RepID=UPI000DF4ECD2|nr:uncharacterized protein LOC112898131 [Panicum hallii]